MNPYDIDRRALRRPALFLLAVMMLVSAVVWTSSRYHTEHRTSLLQERARLSELQDRYRAAVEAGDIVRTSMDRYRRLQHRGFFGDERRLLWIESLRTSGNDNRLYGLQYSLKQRQPLEVSDIPARYWKLFASDMELRLDLLHEGRLLEFFHDLDRQEPGVWQLKSCSLTSVAGETGLTLDMPNVSAVCQLRWYTARDADSVPGDYEEESF